MTHTSFQDPLAGRFLGQPNLGEHIARTEEIRAAYQRIAELSAELHECREYFEERADADCDQDGFIPNEEMRMVTSIDECLHGAGCF